MTSELPRVVAVVLNWNNLPDTLECIESLHASDYEGLEIWVVDNDSREDPTPVCASRFPDVRVIRNASNLGYGGGNNRGLKLAIEEGAHYILLLNNDAIVAPDMVRQLVTALEHNPRIGLATPRVFYYDRPTAVYWDGGTIDWEIGATPHDSRGLPTEHGITRSEWLDGCALFVRASTAQSVGLLDERYFLYFEDTEWSIRTSRLGWINGVVQAAHAWHKVSRSTGGIANPAVRFYYLRNRYFFLKAYRPNRGRFGWRLRYFFNASKEYIGIRHERESRHAVLAGMVSLATRRWGAYHAADHRGPVLLLDAILIPVTKVARPVKRFLWRLVGAKRDVPD